MDSYSQHKIAMREYMKQKRAQEKLADPVAYKAKNAEKMRAYRASKTGVEPKPRTAKPQKQIVIDDIPEPEIVFEDEYGNEISQEEMAKIEKKANREMTRLNMAKLREERKKTMTKAEQLQLNKRLADQKRILRANKRIEAGLPPPKPRNSKYQVIKYSEPIPIYQDQIPTTDTTPQPADKRQLATHKAPKQPTPPAVPTTRAITTQKSEYLNTLHIPSARAIFSQMKVKNTDRPLGQVTVNNYSTKLDRVSNIIQGHLFNGSLKFLGDPEKVIRRLQEYRQDNGQPLTGLQNYMSPIVNLLRFYKVSEAIVEPYSNFLKAGVKATKFQLGEQIATEKEIAQYVPLSTVEKDIKKYNIFEDKQIVPEKLENKVILMLYYNNYWIPRNDLWEMKISNVNNIKKLSKEYNHLLIDTKTGLPTKFVVNKYKTFAKYGQKIFIVPKELAVALQLYISVFNRSMGDFLFTTKAGKQYADSNFIRVIQRATQAITGKAFSVQAIRQSHVIDFYNKAKKPNLNDKEAFHSGRLLHSHDVSVGTQYHKLNLD